MFLFGAVEPRALLTTDAAGLGKSTRVARDREGKNIRIPADMNYSDWKKVYIDQSMSLKDWQAARGNNITLPRNNDSSNVEKPRTLEEAQAAANKLNQVLGKYVTRKSKWSGVIVPSAYEFSAKEWNCDILLKLDNCPDMIILHELLHARSVSYSTKEIWRDHMAIEEASVQLLAQEIAKIEKIPLVPNDMYDKWTDILRKFNSDIGAYPTDLRFAQTLLRVRLVSRINWLLEKASRFVINNNLEPDDFEKITNPLGKIEWE